MESGGTQGRDPETTQSVKDNMGSVRSSHEELIEFISDMPEAELEILLQYGKQLKLQRVHTA